MAMDYTFDCNSSCNPQKNLMIRCIVHGKNAQPYFFSQEFDWETHTSAGMLSNGIMSLVHVKNELYYYYYTSTVELKKKKLNNSLFSSRDGSASQQQL